MLRGPWLYPTVAKRWTADIEIVQNTRDAYLSILRCLQVRVGKKRFNEITPEEVRQFVMIADDGSTRCDRSRRKYLRVVWAVYDWALDPEVGLTVVNPASRMRAKTMTDRRKARPIRHGRWLGERNALTFVASIRSGGRPIDRRDAFMIGFYLTTGLRVSELLTRRWSDIDLAAGTIQVLGKNRKLATLSLPAPARKLLVAWRSELVAAVGHDDVADWPLVPLVKFVPVRWGECPTEGRILWNRPLRSSQGVRQIVVERAQVAGLGHVAPHDLRRTFAGIMADRGVSIEDIRSAMRHSNVATTQIYLEDRPRVVSGLDDLDFG